MVKKEEKTESCQCSGNCCCSSKILLILIALIGAIAAIFACIYSCKALHTAQDSYNLNVLSAGGIENFNKMNELYASDAYKKYATDQTNGYVESFLSTYGNNNEAEESDNTEEIDNTEETNTDTISEGSEDIKAVVEDMLASSPIRGDENARFTIVEYTELHCPYCQRHSQEGTINAVIEQFPGEVNSISKHFIIHGEDALNLAAAMECISELKPEVYHEAFEKAFEAYPVNMDSLIGIATELGVEEAGLKTCIDEGRYTQAVQDMMNQGNQLFGVNGTPGNVIIDRETGRFELVSGAYPVETFVETINKMKNA